jgi:Ras-related protein Rab-1A
MSAKYIIKILTLGDTSVGKSSIVLRFSDDKFDDKIFSTIGIDFKTKYIKLDKFSVKVLIWDTAGQEKFQNIAKQYYKGANGVLLIYDISNRKSFERIDFWLKELKENNRIDELFLYLVGNKIDMEDKRVISYQEGEKYAKKNDINFFEVSAKSGKGVTELFNNVINGVMENILKKNEKEEIEDKVRLSTFLEKNYKKEKNKKCCF